MKTGIFWNDDVRVRVEDRGIPGGTITMATSITGPFCHVWYDRDAHEVTIITEDAKRKLSDYDFMEIVAEVSTIDMRIHRRYKTETTWLLIGQELIATARRIMERQGALT